MGGRPDLTTLLYFLYFISIGAELLPVVVFRYRGSHDRTRAKVALLCLAWFGFDIVTALAGLAGHNNLWLEYLLDPIQACIVFWLLYDWQTTSAARRAIRWLMPAYLLSVLILTFRFEDPNTFSLLSATETSIMLLCVILYTLIARSLVKTGASLLDQDWFWICAGLALYFSLEAGVAPLLRYLVSQNNDAAWMVVQNSRVVTAILALLILTRGMLCPEQATAGPEALRNTLPLTS